MSPIVGSGTMTPIAGGLPGAATTVMPLPYTLLSLPRYAKMCGINPMHFAGATAVNLNPVVMPVGSTCGEVWARHDWQNTDRISHESLAYAIRDAEHELAKSVGYWAAPTWLTEEMQDFPRDFYRTSLYQIRDVRQFRKGVSATWGRIIGGGRRAVTLIGTATVAGGSLVYSDEDADGLFETATITLATTITDIREIHAFYTGMAGDMDYEIRMPRSISISGGNVTLVFDSWWLINPELYEVYPTDAGFAAIDISNTANFVTSVDLYRVYNDTTLTSAQFMWESATPALGCADCSGTGCPACSYTTQNGCLQLRDGENGIVVPLPASYADGEWTVASFTECRAPDRVGLWYYAGNRDERYLRSLAHDPLSDYWAWVIIWLATARLERPPCSCGRLQDFFDTLREDLTHSTGGSSFFTPERALDNPFGTRRGEVMAWRRIKNLMPKKVNVALV